MLSKALAKKKKQRAPQPPNPGNLDALLQQQKAYVQQMVYELTRGSPRMLSMKAHYQTTIDPQNIANMYSLWQANAENKLHVYADYKKGQPNSCGVDPCPLGDTGETCGCGTPVTPGLSCMNGTWCLGNPSINVYITFANGYVINNASTSNSCCFDGNDYGECSCADGAAAQLQAMWYFNGVFGTPTKFVNVTTGLEYTVFDFINANCVWANPDDVPSGWIMCDTATNQGASAAGCYCNTAGILDEQVFPWVKYANCTEPGCICSFPENPYQGGIIYFATGDPALNCTNTSDECASSLWWWDYPLYPS